MDTHMNIDEWSLSQCRDYLATVSGWHQDPNVGRWHKPNCTPYANDGHPIPATLDEAAKLPEEWKMEGVEWYPSTVEAKAINLDDVILSAEVDLTNDYTVADELLARFRLRCRVESLTVRAES